MRMIVNSSFGLTIRLTRENLDRAKFIGINVRRYQLINFIIAGVFAGVAGGLFTELNRFAQTEFLHWSRSGDAIFACLVGGMYSFVGPAIGAPINSRRPTVAWPSAPSLMPVSLPLTP